MQSMKKLIKKMLMLAILVAMICAVWVGTFFSVVPPQHTDNYNAALIDKINRLETLNGPKIILVGNSNLAYGMDSGLLQSALGMEVVNLGLHGGLGNRFAENCALLNIQKGDIIVVCHSDFSDASEFQADLAWITLENNRELYKIPDFQHWMKLIPAFPDYAFTATSLYLRHVGNQNEDLVYSREAFNEYGDNVSVRKSTVKELDLSTVQVPQISNECVERLNSINEYCSEKGAYMVIAGYPILTGEGTPVPADYDVFYQSLQENLTAEVISDYKDYCFPEVYFYDAILHLTNQGAQARTRQLIQDLKAWKTVNYKN